MLRVGSRSELTGVIIAYGLSGETIEDFSKRLKVRAGRNGTSGLRLPGGNVEHSVDCRGSPSEIRLVVVTDIRFYRESLAAVLADLPEVARVATAGDGLGGITDAQRLGADLVLLDMALAGAAAIVRSLTQGVPAVPVVALGVAETEADVLACVELGVCGYVPREASLEQLQRVVRHALRGEVICSPGVAGGLFRRVARLAAATRPAAPTDRLTTREREILSLIGLGLSNRQIAGNLGIQLCTVKNHVHNILEKMGVEARSEAAAVAHRSF
jgi:two-component system, NarL family, nitrate/nitrite response regulator NarL